MEEELRKLKLQEEEEQKQGKEEEMLDEKWKQRMVVKAKNEKKKIVQVRNNVIENNRFDLHINPILHDAMYVSFIKHHLSESL